MPSNPKPNPNLNCNPWAYLNSDLRYAATKFLPHKSVLYITEILAALSMSGTVIIQGTNPDLNSNPSPNPNPNPKLRPTPNPNPNPKPIPKPKHKPKPKPEPEPKSEPSHNPKPCCCGKRNGARYYVLSLVSLPELIPPRHLA